MPDDNQKNRIELSRRKILGGMGTVGAAGLGAGMGAIAFLSDEEQVANNQFVAGEFDLKVDWEQTYNGDPVNAFPDENGDDVQDDIKTREDIRDELATDELPIDSPSVETAFRAQFADVPDDLSRPLIELDDVKPGDSGEITFSLHLFDNPGYIWMNGRCLENAENGIIEAEGDDTDEDGSTGPMGGELLDAIRVTLWYDDGDNVLDTDEQVIFEGPLSHALVLLSNGLPLDGNPTTLFSEANFVADETSGNSLLQGRLAASGDNDARDCFESSTTQHIGFSWELPVDHANELQTDSVSFDLGFYAEQCRHNDGSGQGEQLQVQALCHDWCLYEVIDVGIPNPPGLCPIVKDDMICVACQGRFVCQVQRNDTALLDVYATPAKNNRLCRVVVKSLRSGCDGCPPEADHKMKLQAPPMPPPPPPPGPFPRACCLPNGECRNLPAGRCRALGGTPLPAGKLCPDPHQTVLEKIDPVTSACTYKVVQVKGGCPDTLPPDEDGIPDVDDIIGVQCTDGGCPSGLPESSSETLAFTPRDSQSCFECCDVVIEPRSNSPTCQDAQEVADSFWRVSDCP